MENKAKQKAMETVWINATKEEVRKYLEENTNIEEYEQKKKQLLCEIEKRRSKY